MDDSDRAHNDWIREWIEQQRLLLQQRSAQQTGGSQQIKDQVMDLGTRWLDLGQAYLSGLQQFAQGAPGGAAGGTGFKLGEEILNGWQAQWRFLAKGAAQPDDPAATWNEVLRQLPPIGLAREHTATWRELAEAQAECQRLEQELRTMLYSVQTEALNLVERRVREREAGQPTPGFRDLYDLWVECGEQVYAQVAHSEAYCRLQAQLGNATMQLRARQQKLIEQALKQFDLPTRSELNSVHRQLREQGKLVRELKEQVAALQASAGASSPRRKRKSS